MNVKKATDARTSVAKELSMLFHIINESFGSRQ